MAQMISDEQRVQLRNDLRFQDMVRVSAANHATFLHGLDGASLPPGMTHEQWALQRFFFAEPILQHPNEHDVHSWASQYAILLKGFVVWDTDINGTIDFMIANNTFEQLAAQTFVLRAQNVNF
jgi:hypothetical protein